MDYHKPTLGWRGGFVVVVETAEAVAERRLRLRRIAYKSDYTHPE